MAAPAVKKPYKRERKVKTVEPVAVLGIEAYERIMTTMTMLIGKDNETAQTRININFNAKKVLAEMRVYRRRMTEYYRLPD